MKCHYEVLGVPQNASSDDIKKSYRKLALEWHPDKNLHRPEEATETFQLIQQAYEILADPQERAWYDRNRDKILRGDEDYTDNQLDVYHYFNTSRYKGYGDDEKSFYTVYREVFEKIVAEDKPFMDDDVTIPNFGYSYSPYKDEVYPFYAYWQSYCTAKPYTWVDKFDLAEARKCAVGRQVLRAMERENKKLREMHKKARNEEIRQLVAFVKKRDKRIEDYKKHVEKQNVEKAKKAEEQRRKQIAERKKCLEQYKESEWVSMSSLENHLTEIEAHLDCEFGAESCSDKGDDSSASDAEDLYCIACDKAFRSTKAMINHQKSKKHRENVSSLKEYMEDDVITSDQDETVPNGNPEDGPLKSDEEEEICSEPKQSTRKKKKKKKKLVNLPDMPKEPVLNSSTFESSADDFSLGTEFYSGDTSEAITARTDVSEEHTVISEETKKSKSSQRKAKKKAALNTKGEAQHVTTCVKCGKVFESRNKLFDHLKETGHSSFLSDKDLEITKLKKKETGKV